MAADTLRKAAGLVLVSLALVCSARGKDNTGTEKVPARQETARAVTAGTELTVYYFHTARRCPTCNMFEEIARDVVSNDFKARAAAGEISFTCINTEEEGNRHYVQDYRLYTKSIVLSLTRDGKEAAWQNLDKIWELARDPDKLREYIRSGIAGMLKG